MGIGNLIKRERIKKEKTKGRQFFKVLMIFLVLPFFKRNQMMKDGEAMQEPAKGDLHLVSCVCGDKQE